MGEDGGYAAGQANSLRSLPSRQHPLAVRHEELDRLLVFIRQVDRRHRVQRQMQDSLQGMDGCLRHPAERDAQASGDEVREQGLDKSGNGSVRTMAIEIAWVWLRYQPQSELSQWYQARFGHGGKRLRKIGIVALARKLLIALWRYLETGEIPAGAQLKA